MNNKSTFSFQYIPNIERLKYLELYLWFMNVFTIPLVGLPFLVSDEKTEIALSIALPILLSIPVALWFRKKMENDKKYTLQLNAHDISICSNQQEVLFQKSLSDCANIRLFDNVKYDDPRWAWIAKLGLIHPVTYLQYEDDGEPQRLYFVPDSFYQLRQLSKLFYEHRTNLQQDSLSANV